MWVELIGLPGVGKTTLIEKALPELSSKYVIIRSDKRSFLQKIYGKILYYFRFKTLVKDETLAKKLSYRQSFQFRVSPSQNVFYFDSGLLQVILEYYIASDQTDLDDIVQIVSKLKMSQKIVLVKDDIFDIAYRELNRPKRRFHFDEDELIKRYKDAEQFIEKILTSSINDSEVIILDKNESALDLTRAIC